jgi:hypothetical protein
LIIFTKNNCAWVIHLTMLILPSCSFIGLYSLLALNLDLFESMLRWIPAWSFSTRHIRLSLLFFFLCNVPIFPISWEFF